MRESHTRAPNANACTSAWLNSKVSRRVAREDLLREGESLRAERAGKAAESFLYDLERKAELRDEIRSRMDKSKLAQEEVLRQKADAYRARLRGYLRPELRDE